MEAPSSIELVCDPFSRPPLSENDILLRPLEFADVPAWYEYLSMPTVVENTSWNVRSPDELRRACRALSLERSRVVNSIRGNR